MSTKSTIEIMPTPSTIINEQKVIGVAKRILIDKAAKLWQRISYWTHARDVEFDDGKTAQEKLRNINGITSSFNDGRDDIAASSVLTKSIRDDLDDGKINNRIQLVIQDDGTLGWRKDGADAVIPFTKGRPKDGDILAYMYGAVEGWDVKYGGGCNYVGILPAGYKSIQVIKGENTALITDGVSLSGGRYYFNNYQDSHVLKAYTTEYHQNASGSGFSFKVIGYTN